MTEQKNPWGKPKKPGGNGLGGAGGGSSGGGNEGGPDLEELISRQHEKIKNILAGRHQHDDRRMFILIVMGALLLWLATGIYRVDSGEQGVVLRFGQYHRTTGSGLNYHLPYPLETVLIPSVESVNKVEIGSRAGTDNPSVRQAVSQLGVQRGDVARDKSLMLTGDRNIVDIDFEVQWKIDTNRPQDFLFNVRDPEGTVRLVAESAMREVVGRNKLDEILTTAQSSIAEDTKEIMQRILDGYRAGVDVIAVNLSRPDVPSPVLDEFQDVKRAEQDKETAESVAEGYRNDILPRAKGEAVKMVQEAIAYKNQVIAEAEGDAARFINVYNAYAAAKDVTKKRIYLETMESLLRGMPKIVSDSKAGNQGVLPILQLPPAQAIRSGATTPTPLTPVTQAQSTGTN